MVVRTDLGSDKPSKQDGKMRVETQKPQLAAYYGLGEGDKKAQGGKGDSKDRDKKDNLTATTSGVVTVELGRRLVDLHISLKSEVIGETIVYQIHLEEIEHKDSVRFWWKAVDSDMFRASTKAYLEKAAKDPVLQFGPDGNHRIIVSSKETVLRSGPFIITDKAGIKLGLIQAPGYTPAPQRGNPIGDKK
jgi:hypothetical protein